MTQSAPDIQAQIRPIHTFLEFGTLDADLIDLMGLGLGRSTAEQLRAHARRLGWPLDRPEQLLDRVQALSRGEIRAWELDPEVWVDLCMVAGRDTSEVIWDRRR